MGVVLGLGLGLKICGCGPRVRGWRSVGVVLGLGLGLEICGCGPGALLILAVPSKYRSFGNRCFLCFALLSLFLFFLSLSSPCLSIQGSIV